MTPRWVSVEEYLRMRGKPNLKYRDGIVTPKDKVPEGWEEARPELDVPEQPIETPLLCCEILGVGGRVGTAMAICEAYHDWGVPHCWIIDAGRHSVWEYPKGGEPAEVVDVLRAGEITVNLAELFSAIKA